jgi:hypothetical protein
MIFWDIEILRYCRILGYYLNILQYPNISTPPQYKSYFSSIFLSFSIKLLEFSDKTNL